MRIGFDLDNIIISNPPFIPQAIIERLYRKKTNGVLFYRIPSEAEQFIRQASHLPVFRPVIKKNLTYLRSLTKETHTLYLISSRFGFLKKQTEKVVRKHKLDKIFDTLYFNYDNKQPHIFKTDTIKTLKLDKFVDDDLHLLKYVAAKNNRIKLYWLNKQIQKKISRNIRAVTKISDMLEE